VAAFEVQAPDIGPTLILIPREVGRELADTIREAALTAEAAMRTEIVQRLAKDPTGRLARSVRTELAGEGDSLIAVVSPYTPYAVVQDQGDPQHGINGNRMLSIPIPGRVPRGKWPRDWGQDELRLVPGRGGRASLLWDVANDRPAYVLKRSVAITGVGYVAAAAETVQAELDAIVGEHVDAALADVEDEAT